MPAQHSMAARKLKQTLKTSTSYRRVAAASMTPMNIQQWERATAVPLMVAAAGFLAAYAIPILNPDLDHRWLIICEAATWGTGLLFAATTSADSASRTIESGTSSITSWIS